MSENPFADHRRNFFKTSAAVLLAATLAPRMALSSPLYGTDDAAPATAEERFNAIMKSRGSMAQADIRWWMCGELYLCRPGIEPLLPLMRIETVNVQAWTPVRGGVRLIAREIGYYADIETGQPLDTWKNPLTGEVAAVPLLADGPQATVFTPASVHDTPAVHRSWARHGDEIVLTEDRAFGSGDTTMDVTSYYSSLAQIQDDGKPAASADATAQKIFAAFPAWMKMKADAGFLYARIYGTKTSPDVVVDAEKLSALTQRFPGVL